MKNLLTKSEYLISHNLHKVLNEANNNPVNDNISKNSGIYLITARELNKGKKVLLYNYIYYPPIFTLTYLHFIVTRNHHSIRFREWGDNLLLLNKDVLFNLDNVSLDKLNFNFEDNKYILNDSNMMKWISDNINLYYLASNIYETIRITNKLNVITYDYKEISNIVDHAYNKNYKEFVNLVMPTLSNRIDDNIDNYKDLNLNILNTLLIVVRDINLFTKEMSDKGYDVNEGNQKWRGQVNCMNAILNSMDMDYRNSLYNHNNYHVNSGLVDRKLSLEKNKFSFQNIHMRIGNIRWYSTGQINKRSYSTKKKADFNVLTKKLIERASAKNSFQTDSEIYLYLSSFIKSSPINETTERSIENYLLNFYNQALQESKDSRLIKYDLFSTSQVKNYIKDSIDIIEDYLNNFRKKSFNINVKRLTPKIKSSYYLNIILTELDNAVITEICLGIIARVISNFNKTSEDSIAQNVITDLGDMIIKSYFFHLYKNYIIDNIKIFVNDCEKYLNDYNLSKNEIDSLNKIIYQLKNNSNKFEVYEIKNLVRNILKIVDKSKININSVELILDYTLSDWKLDNKNIIDIYDNNLRFHIASIVIDWLKESNLIQENLLVIGRKERRTYYIPSTNLISLLDTKTKSVSSLPLRIPMIVKPKPYSRSTINEVVKERLGGYLINDEKVTDSMIIPNWELKESSIIQDTNVVYNLVNNVNSVGFKINKDMLDFIYLHGEKFNLLINNIDFNLNKSKISKREYTELESYISKLDLQENILGLAEVYSNVSEFYLPVRIDYRGRMNCVSQYLNYQSNELSKSLLLFSKGEKLYKSDNTAINYFKAYGANCFGNRLDKKSWMDRSKWIDENQFDIVNYVNGKLISQADNKLLFTAFCIEYCKWLKCYHDIEKTYFTTYLPIQLDATCNGYQHLSLLISDYDMAKELNLTKSNKDDIPKDYYGFMAIKLTDLFKSKLSNSSLSEEDKLCYNRLVNLFIRRSTIKKAIMTIPYNVSTIQMIRYLKEHFNDIRDDKKDVWSSYDLQYQYKEDSNVVLSNKDISFIASGLREVLEKNFPRLKQLIIYLKTIAKIFNKLNLYIPWGTASGLLVNQSYTSSEEIKLRPFSYDKSSFTLKVSTGKLSGNKQIRAFMPNLIHSLDAAALALLAEYHFNSDNDNKSFYAIHDCFAVTSNNVEMLIKYLKLVYIKIYSEDDYLRNLNDHLITNVKYHYGEKCYNDSTRELKVIIDNLEINEIFPDINVVIGKELPTPDLIKDSSYIIN